MLLSKKGIYDESMWEKYENKFKSYVRNSIMIPSKPAQIFISLDLYVCARVTSVTNMYPVNFQLADSCGSYPIYLVFYSSKSFVSMDHRGY